jgi:hypothetical protein
MLVEEKDVVVVARNGRQASDKYAQDIADLRAIKEGKVKQKFIVVLIDQSDEAKKKRTGTGTKNDAELYNDQTSSFRNACGRYRFDYRLKIEPATYQGKNAFKVTPGEALPGKATTADAVKMAQAVKEK